jgi:hypothetical protein
MTDTATKKIAELNDLCRTAMGVAGKLFQTAGISALSCRALRQSRRSIPQIPVRGRTVAPRPRRKATT